MDLHKEFEFIDHFVIALKTYQNLPYECCQGLGFFILWVRYIDKLNTASNADSFWIWIDDC